MNSNNYWEESHSRFMEGRESSIRSQYNEIVRRYGRLDPSERVNIMIDTFVIPFSVGDIERNLGYNYPSRDFIGGIDRGETLVDRIRSLVEGPTLKDVDKPGKLYQAILMFNELPMKERQKLVQLELMFKRTASEIEMQTGGIKIIDFEEDLTIKRSDEYVLDVFKKILAHDKIKVDLFLHSPVYLTMKEALRIEKETDADIRLNKEKYIKDIEAHIDQLISEGKTREADEESDFCLRTSEPNERINIRGLALKAARDYAWEHGVNENELTHNLVTLRNELDTRVRWIYALRTDDSKFFKEYALDIAPGIAYIISALYSFFCVNGSVFMSDYEHTENADMVYQRIKYRDQREPIPREYAKLLKTIKRSIM